MRQINKGNEPESFSAWKKHNQNVTWNAFSDSNMPHRDVYVELKETLVTQQDKMCCYCEIALSKDTDAHVEHLKDRCNYGNKTYCFNNLFASCHNKSSCGHKKGRGYFNNMISPLDRCDERFTYTGDGRIIPIDESDANALQTIDLLGLNCKRLTDRRKSIIKTLEMSDYDYLKITLENYWDWYGGFLSVIEYMIETHVSVNVNV